MITHQTLRKLVYFAAIADAGSIRGAAKRLNLSVPVLSETLSDLEAELGVSLASRTTRSFALSDAGVRTQIAARQILDIAQQLTELTSPSRGLQGRLGMTLPVELAEFWLPHRITTFQKQHPGLEFDIDVTDQLVDLRASEIELAIRTDYVNPGEKTGTDQSLDLVVVSTNPAVIGRSGKVDLPLIDSKADRKLFAMSRKGAGNVRLKFERTHKVTNRSAGLQMVRAGFGAVMVMRGSVVDDLKTGRLVEIFPEYDFGSIALQCHFRDRLPGIPAKAFAQEIGLYQM